MSNSIRVRIVYSGARAQIKHPRPKGRGCFNMRSGSILSQQTEGNSTRRDSKPCLLSIAIVTFNSQKFIQKTLDSIFSYLPKNVGANVILVDNNSSDSTPAILNRYRRRHTNVSCIHNASNLGFACAHNLAIRSVNSRYHTICNPDILISKDIFTPLIDFMEAHPRVGLSCPKFLNLDGSVQPLNRRSPNLMDLFLRRFLPAGLEPFFNKRLRAYDMRDVGYDRSYDVPFISGAFMFCLTHALKAVGGFDERYFLYFEDADLSRKMQQFGYRTVFFPDVYVLHAWERLAHKSLRGSLVFAQSAYRYFRKWGFTWW